MRAVTLAAIIICATSLVALSACGGDTKTSSVVATKTVATKSTPAPTSAVAATRTSSTPDATTQRVLMNAEVTNAGDHDHAVFTFDTSVTAPHVDFLESAPTSCGSGAAVPVDGHAYLEVRFSPAVAHDDAGASTVAQTSLKPNLPAVLGAVQTCDLEGTVTWVLGLVQVLPVHRSTEAGNTFFVDIDHP